LRFGSPHPVGPTTPDPMMAGAGRRPCKPIGREPLPASPSGTAEPAVMTALAAPPMMIPGRTIDAGKMIGAGKMMGAVPVRAVAVLVPVDRVAAAVVVAALVPVDRAAAAVADSEAARVDLGAAVESVSAAVLAVGLPDPVAAGSLLAALASAAALAPDNSRVGVDRGRADRVVPAAVAPVGLDRPTLASISTIPTRANFDNS
jgi:hypothetical protein